MSTKKPWSLWHQRLHSHLQAYPNLLPKNAVLLLSISGGQDSMALLKIISDLQRIYEWKIFIWHGDHGWHEQSKSFGLELKSWCNDQGLQFFFDRTNKKEIVNEEQARNWRYKNLIRRAKDISPKNIANKFSYVLTGHTGSDRAETLIFNLSRGSDLNGLCSMPECRLLANKIKLIRPLLCFTREETAEICKDFNLPIWIDPSNSDNRISRNKIRNEVIPILNSLHPGCSLRISALAERIYNIKGQQDLLIDFVLENIKDSKYISRKKICNFPPNVRSTILSYWIRSNQAPSLSSTFLEELSIKIEPLKPPGYRRFGKSWQISWKKDLIHLELLTSDQF